MTTAKMTVAQFLTAKIEESPKSQKEIAAELGYEAANIMTMFKQGATKLPLNTVGPMARALDIDPVFLLRMAFREYYPDTFDAVEHALGGTILTENERKLLEQFRRCSDHSDPEMLVFGPTRAIALVLADR